MTANDWFRLPRLGDGTDGNEFRPDFKHKPIEGWVGFELNQNFFIARVYAAERVLTELAKKQGVQRFGSVPSHVFETVGNVTTDDPERSFSLTLRS